MKDVIDFFKPTITGPDGKASHRRLTVIYFVGLLSYMVFKTATGSIFPEIAWIVVSGGAGLFSSLSIWQDKVNKLKNENSDNYGNDSKSQGGYYGDGGENLNSNPPPTRDFKH